MLIIGGLVSRQAREGGKVANQFDRPWVVDASAFESQFSAVAVADHRIAITETLA